MELSDRKKAILKSIVDNYIATGDPVGSKYLSESSSFNLSSATIRNEMSELEDLGYLKQPHASSGRVPTALGYRTYIDSLMERYFLSIEELQVLDDVLSSKLNEFGALMEEASRAIGDMTNYTSFAFMSNSDGIVDRYETLYIDEYSFLLIMICKEGHIRNRHVKLHDPIDKKMVGVIKVALNEILSGVSSEEITLSVILKFEEKLGRYKAYSSTILRVVYEMLGSFDSEKVHIDGVTKLLSYPEFFNVAKVQSVLGLLEERQKFTRMLKNALPGQTSVFIGDDEQEGATLPDTGFVFHPISIGKKVIGAIGVIGPKRMDYKKVIASLNYFVSGITDSLNDNTLQDNTGENDYGKQEED
ncbi:MAG: heat-inducible transcription repressor HrcA [Clostridiales bacterium GWF2_36_10]|nr:MAG: heat-inducible transcription repressor HrcA [Clostridiales bacterium GWF2_36_10]HAN21917.1 heat-inducible transcription repressor HrcA [Clostridiales bacterium]